MLAPFWEVLGGQAPLKIHQQSSKMPNKLILGCVLDMSVFEGGFWESFDTVLKIFRKDFWWILRAADHMVDSYFAPCWDKL